MTGTTPIATLDQLGRGPVVAAHVNVGHLALRVLDCCGNPLGIPVTVLLALDGLPALTRDARARDTMSQVLALADVYCAGAVVIEDLDFAEQRTGGPRRIAVRYDRRSPGRTSRSSSACPRTRPGSTAGPTTSFHRRSRDRFSGVWAILLFREDLSGLTGNRRARAPKGQALSFPPAAPTS